MREECCAAGNSVCLLIENLLTFLTFDAKSNVLRVVKLKVKSVHLLIYTGMGNSCLTFGADSPTFFLGISPQLLLRVINSVITKTL